MSTGIYGVALSGLNAAQVGMRTTGHNLANVNTTGYSRQTLEQSASVGQALSAGFLGQGAAVTAVRRVYTDHLVTQAQSQQAHSAQYSTLAGELSRLGDLLGNADANLGAAVDGFFGAVATLAQAPGDPAARQALLSGGQALVARFAAVDTSLDEIGTRLEQQLRAGVAEVNDLAQQVARLNGAISELGGTGAAPNDLMDQRDALIARINQQVRAVVVNDGDHVNLFLSNGQPLVLDNSAMTLTLTPGTLDSRRLELGMQSGNTVQVFRQSDLSGGSIGGILAFRDGALAQARNEVGRLATSIAAGFNAQQALGQDRLGAPGAALFAAPQPTVLPASGNSGSGVLTPTLTNAADLTTSDYVIEYDGSRFVVTRVPEGTQTNFLTFPQTLGGVTLAMAGAPAAGDRFLLQPTRDAAGQIGMALTQTAGIASAAPVRGTAAATNSGSGSITLQGVSRFDATTQQPVTISFTAANTFSVTGAGTGNPTGLSYTPGMALSFNGWTMTLDGAPRAGDTFTVDANSNASGDNFNVRALASLADAPRVDGGSLGAAFAALIGRIGAEAQQAGAAQTASERLLAGTQQAVASVSGVNLDEEAANLMRYQQAYQAAGKVISVANTLFDSLLQAVR